MAHLAMRMKCKLGKRVFLASILGSLLIGLLSVNLAGSDWTLQTSEIIVPDQYSTIQEAIDNAVDGDTIFVRAGTYYEHVVVSKTVSLVGEDWSATIIDGGGTGSVMYILRDNVSVTGFTVQRGQFGIYIQNSRYTEIFNNTVAHNYGGDWDAGVRLESAGYTVIRDNEIFDNWRGILVYSSSPYVSVYGNNVTSNEYGVRVAMGGSSYVNVSGNRVANNRGYGIDVTGFGGGGESNYATIERNLIVNNTFEAVGLGEGSNYNTVVQNNMIENGHAGVTLERYSNYNTIVQNNMIRNAYGICFDLFTINSTQNTILNNNMINNTQQVRIVPGSVNAWNGSYASGGNYWSDYSGLDQFSGPYQNVTGRDGIGDAPYVIDANNRDGYPLMDLWRPNACDWTVDDDGFADFDTIQEAINNAFDGDAIFVKAGTYYEHVVVNKTVSLVGEDVHATIVDANGTGRVFSVSQGYVNITGFTIRRSGSNYIQDAGIWIEGMGHCNIFGNVLTENDFFGVHLAYASFNNISGNVITKTKVMSIVISTANENVVSGNILEDHYCGIDIHALSNDNYIMSNVIRRGDCGVVVDNSHRNVISGNNVTDHKWKYGYNLTGQKFGVSIQDQSSQNMIVNNMIADTDGNGVQVIDAAGNGFYHNNFINNSRQAYVSPPNPAYWDNGYPSGGNYWSDYNGTDVDGDGIGDSQYEIGGDSVDRYPLISPWTRLLGDINDDRTVDTFDALMLAAAFGSTAGSKNWIAEADLNRDSTIDIFDAIILASNFEKQRI